MSVRFRFDASDHTYYALDTGEELPHITGMLEAAGLIDDRWYTEESSERGRHVHDLTAEFDLGAIDPKSCTSRFKGYLQAWATVSGILRFDWTYVEEPRVHPFYRYGGRPDRVGRIGQAHGVGEVKSGDPAKSHAIQTAIQCILVADELGLPAPSLVRYAVYVKADGSYKVMQHDNRRDFDKALEIIKETCK